MQNKKILKKHNVLVTGASGLLGSALVTVLQKAGYGVYSFEGDITKAGDVKKYDGEKNIDWLVHTAALTDVNRCEKEQEVCYGVNVQGTKNMLDLAKKMGARFLYISTASVFDGQKGNYKESSIPNPKNVYNETKKDGERATQEYEKGLILRINLIGVHPDRPRGQNFFEWLVDSIKANKDIKLFSDVMVNPLSNWTVADFIEKIIEKNPSEKILHVGSKNVLSKADIGKILIEKLGNYTGKAEYASVDAAGGALRPKQMWLNTDYTCEKMNWQMPTLESEIEKILSNR